MNFSKRKLVPIVFITLLSIFAYYQTTPQAQQTNTQRLLASTYTTTSTRTASVNAFCAGKSRNDLIDADQKSLYSFFSTQMQSSFKLDGNEVIVQVINGNTEKAKTQLQSNITSFAMFIGPFVVGLVLILLLTPFLLCCCACPESCPSKCCRKSEEEPYTTCELYWPTVTLMLALLLAIGACVAGFANSQSIAKNIDSNLCSLSIIVDDIINGNVTNNGNSFFSGLKQLNDQLGYLDGNLSSINTTMNSIIPTSTNMSTTKTRGDTALSDIQKIPNNANTGGNMNTIAYNTPFTSSSSSTTISSTFPSFLGSSNTGGLIQTLYTLVQSSITAIDSVAQSALSFNTQATNFHNGVVALQSTITNFTNFMTDADNNNYNLFKNAFDNKSLVVMGVKLVYGVTIAFASLMLLGAIMIAFCDKTNCRYLIYFTCIFFFIIGTLGFFLTIIFSIVAPLTFFGCQFINFSLSSATNFNSNFNKVISDSSFRTYISTCLPSESGDLITAFGGSSVNALLNLSNSVLRMNNFSVVNQSNTLFDGMTTLKTLISNYEKGNVNDITDSASISFLTAISSASSYSSCTATGFTSDSWIPSTNQNPSYIACKVTGNSATSSSCTSNFVSRGGTCNGCMDTTSVLTGYTAKATLLSDLNSRYSGCTTFNTDLSNIWFNYYKIKQAAFTPITARVATADASLNTYANTIITTIHPTFVNAINSLKTTAESVTDPKYGMIAGLNCRLIGEDIQRTFDTLCQSLFTITFYTRLVMGLASFGILFSMCCGVCTGVRFMKHEIRKLNSANNAGLSDQAVEDITNNNFVIPKNLQ